MRQRSAIAFVIMAIFNLIPMLLFENLSVYVYACISCAIILMANAKIFKKNADKYINICTILWMICVIAIIAVYYANISHYGLPYILSDDYAADTQWIQECIDGNYYTIRQMREGSNFFYLANCNGYILFLAYIKRFAMLLGGYHTVDSRLINMLAVLLTALLVGGYAEEAFGWHKKYTKMLIVTIAIFPNILYIASHVYRDAYQMLLLVLLFYIWRRREDKFRRVIISKIMYSVLIIWMIYWIRAFAVIYVVFIIAISIYSKDIKQPILKKRLTNFQWTLIGIAIIVLLVGLSWASQSWRVIHYLTAYTVINTQNSGIQGIVYGISIFPFGWILRIIFYLLSPFYPQGVGRFVFGDYLDLIYLWVTLGTCFLFFIYPYLLKAISRMNSLSMIFIVLFFSTAIVTSGFRHILMSYPFMFIMSIREYQLTSQKKRVNIRKWSLVALIVWWLINFILRMV